VVVLVVAVAAAPALEVVLVPVLELVEEEVVEVEEALVGVEVVEEVVAAAGVVELEATVGLVEDDVRMVVNPELVVTDLVLDVVTALEVTVGVNVPGTFPAFLLNVYDAET
jgi:hypothetical protein